MKVRSSFTNDYQMLKLYNLNVNFNLLKIDIRKLFAPMLLYMIKFIKLSTNFNSNTAFSIFSMCNYNAFEWRIFRLKSNLLLI